jgi:2-polyprenyl-3-methyl-5-hydroxy-6-metoxy-1,4-benzoquinol methylase
MIRALLESGMGGEMGSGPVQGQPTALMVCQICGSGDVRRAVFVRDGYELARCSNCGLAFVTNPPNAAELEHLYSFASGYHVGFRDDLTEIAQRFALAQRQLAAIARHHASGRCLDIGASAGFFVKTAADAGWDAHGIELSKDTSGLARERYGVDVACARLEEATFEPESFDAITLWDLIEHVPDPLDTMHRVARLLKPGGVVGILTPNLDGLFARSSYKVARRIGHWPAVEPPLHLFQFSIRSLTALLDRVGLEILEIEHESQPLRYVFGGPRHLLKPERFLYAAIFAPVMLIGPLVRAGDEILVVARRSSSDATDALPT